MRKLITILALSTIAMAGVSIHLWKELRDARAKVTALTGPSSTSPMPDARAPRTEGGAAPADVTSARTAPDDGKTARQKILEEDFRDAARRQLAQLSDPTMRAQMLEEWKEANLPNKPKYARYLGISESEAERLIEALAELEIAKKEVYSRCTLKRACDFRTVGDATSAARQQALTDLLGAEKQQRFEQYTYSGAERHMAAAFLRGKIPAGSQLSEEQEEQFIAALADERRIIETEIKQRGFEPFVYPMEGVVFTFQQNVFLHGNSDERLKEAVDYNRRIHARAKSILNPRQLAAFEQVQEAGIAGVKYWLRQQERDNATRAATSGESR